MKPLFHPVVLFLYLLPCVALSQTAPLPTPPLPPPPAPSPVVQSLRNKAYDALEPAQRVYDTCPTCYQGYRYRADDTPIDTTFFFGGVFDGRFANVAKALTDTLHFDYLYQFGGPDSLHMFDASSRQSDARLKWVDSLERDFFHKVDSVTTSTGTHTRPKVIYEPGIYDSPLRIRALSGLIRASEGYFGENDTIVHNVYFRQNRFTGLPSLITDTTNGMLTFGVIDILL